MNKTYVITGEELVIGVGYMPIMKDINRASQHQLDTCNRVVVRNGEVIKEITQEDLRRLDVEIAKGGNSWQTYKQPQEIDLKIEHLQGEALYAEIEDCQQNISEVI